MILCAFLSIFIVSYPSSTSLPSLNIFSSYGKGIIGVLVCLALCQNFTILYHTYISLSEKYSALNEMSLISVDIRILCSQLLPPFGEV